MQPVLVRGGMGVIDGDREHGPIGVVFALVYWLIAIGVVIIVGDVAGLVWQTIFQGRGLSFGAAVSKVRRAS